MDWEIDIQVDEPFQTCLDEDWLKLVAWKSLAQEKVPPAELSLVIADDGKVAELNRRYRNHDGTTDVLSFSLREGVKFAPPPDSILHLGEVIISYPQAARQAEAYGYSVAEELALLLVHGILHLLDYDHESPKDARRMRARQKLILESLKGG